MIGVICDLPKNTNIFVMFMNKFNIKLYEFDRKTYGTAMYRIYLNYGIT